MLCKVYWMLVVTPSGVDDQEGKEGAGLAVSAGTTASARSSGP